MNSYFFTYSLFPPTFLPFLLNENTASAQAVFSLFQIIYYESESTLKIPSPYFQIKIKNVYDFT